MKTLKFMLAAATAIGLASASHAAGEWVEEFNTSGDFPNGDVNWVAPADNESTVADGVLNVSVGTDPLTRMLSPSAGEAQAVDMTADDFISATITTDVKFTVTPAADDVTSSDGDKLLVYLKEGSEATNLMVKACAYTPATTRPVAPASFVTNDVVVTASGVNVVPGEWYSLKVVAQKDNDNVVFFNLFIKEKNSESDYVPLVLASTLYGDAENVKIPSLHGTANAGDATLTYVGFAGEGAIDNLAFSKEVQVSYIDFTLAWSDVTPVSYTVNGNEPVAIASDATSPLSLQNILEGGETVVFTFTNADGVTKTKDVVAAADGTISASASDFTWADYLGAAVDGAYQIDDGADLVMLQKGVLSGLATASTTFKQTANIDMTGVANFYGIGWFNASTSFASVPTGVANDGKTDLPFAGTYDGQGYTISNVTIVKHSYAGVFNNVSGTVRNLTVQDIGLSGTCTEWGCAIVGNASGGSLLENLTAVTSSGFNWGNSANHNVAGIVVRPIGAATIRGCVNNANISSVSKRLGGIASFVGSSSVGTVFDSCTNNATLVSTDGTRGVGGILGCAEGGVASAATANDTVIRNCADFGSETAQGSGGHAGAIVGSNWNNTYTYTDDGGNTFKASTVDCGYAKNAVFGRAYAVASTIDATDYLTTVKAADLAAGGTYTLLQDVAAGTVFTLQAAGDTIAFDANGHTFAGTVDSAAAALGVSSATAGTVTTYTAFAAEAQVNSGAKYATLKEAVDAADTGDTVTVLANCSVTNGNTGITFTKGINLVNNYTITIDGANYALRIANGTTTPVTMSGTGSLVWANGSGSPIIVGSNEIKSGYGINSFYEGSFVLNGGTLTSTDKTAKGGNLVKLEAGTFVLNGGTINGGTRGVKADSEGNNATCVLTINGGTIVNTNSAAIAASTAGSGSSTVTVNGGTFTGKLVGTGMVTIPGTSTAKFDRDQSSFCATGYETVLSDGWYVVQAVAPAGEDIAPGGQSSTTYNTQADAEAAVANVTVEPDPAITNQLSAAAATAYAGMFEAKVVKADGDGYKIEVGLTAAAEAALQSVVDDAAAEVVADLTETDVELTTTPGFYYSFEYGTSLGNMAEGARTLATGSKLTLERPTTVGATSGFYKVLVNVTDKQ